MPDLSTQDTVTALATSVAGAVTEAQRESERWSESDPVYGELMATYVELGEVLDAGRHITSATVASLPPGVVQQYESECRALVDRLAELEKLMELSQQQRWAHWCATNMTMEGLGR
ncbi:hypothetical protein AB0383_19560 [Amycolatopsis sp. NPDC051373]|uniref:hypothetical protein n=1 Tax=Amycolatopsis sp. NPDC051373 TaxID=3155801 RepID=UPI00344D1A35